MLPNWKDWKTWSAIERATYVAQVLAPFSLLITVIFAYLSWSEARRSAKLQSEMFAAQNSPVIDLEKARVGKYGYPETVPSVLLTFKNTGSSTASNICLEIKDEFRHPISRVCNPDSFQAQTSLQRDQSFTYSLNFDDSLQSRLKVYPTRAAAISADGDFAVCTTRGTVFYVDFEYSDYWGRKSRGMREVMLCDERVTK
jgi:hypothetical protein